MTKPLFAWAPDLGTVLSARLLDQLGKVIRGAPRNALVAGIAAPDLRGTEHSYFNLACTLAMLIASVQAGLLWDRLGAAFTFYGGALFAFLAVIGIVLLPTRLYAFAVDHFTPPSGSGSVPCYSDQMALTSSEPLSEWPPE